MALKANGGFEGRRSPALRPHSKTRSLLVLLLVWLPFAGLCLFLTSSYLTGSYKDHLRLEAAKNLSLVADFKSRRIAEWLGERRSAVSVIRDNRVLGTYVERWLGANAGPEPEQWIREWLASLRRNFGFNSLTLFDLAGTARLSEPDGRGPRHAADRPGFPDALRTGEVMLTDLHRNRAGKMQLDIWTPLTGSRGKTCAVLRLGVDPETQFYPLVRFWPAHTATAETVLVRREGDGAVVLSAPRHRPDALLKVWRDRTLPSVMAAMGMQGFTESRDYRSRPVLAVMKSIPGTNWELVAKIDAEEAYAPLKRLLLPWILASGLLMLAAMIGLYSLDQRRSAAFYQTRYAMEAERARLAERYEFLVQSASDVFLFVGADGRFLEVNERALAAYGYERDEFMRLRLKDLGAPEYRDDAEIREVFQNVGVAGRVYETFHMRKDGTAFPVEVSARRLLYRGEECIQAAVRDITVRRRAEDALRRSEEKYRTLVEQLPAVTYIAGTGEHASTLWVSPQIETLLGYSQAEWLADNELWEKRLHPEDRERILEAFHRFLTEGGELSIEYRILKRDGSVVWWRDQARMVRASAGDPAFIQGIIFDITAGKAMEEDLRLSRERLIMAQEAAGMGTWDCDMVSNLTSYSAEALRIFGLPPDRSVLPSDAWLPLVHEEDRERMAEEFRSAFRDKRDFRSEYRILRADGSTRWVVVRARVLDDGERPYRVLGAVMDITDQKQSEMELAWMNQVLHYLASQLMRSQDEERRHVARELHDSMGQSLAALTMQLGVLRNVVAGADGKASRLASECASLAGECCREMRTLSYLLHPPLLEELGLDSAIRAHVDGFMQQTGIDVTLAVDPDLGRLSQSLETTLFRLVQEGLANIHRYAASPDAVVRLARCKCGGGIELRIEDHGTGVVPEIDNGDGAAILRLGTGLAAMRERAAELGGKMTVTSSIEGTAVTVSLPAGLLAPPAPAAISNNHYGKEV